MMHAHTLIAGSVACTHEATRRGSSVLVGRRLRDYESDLPRRHLARERSRRTGSRPVVRLDDDVAELDPRAWA